MRTFPRFLQVPRSSLATRVVEDDSPTDGRQEMGEMSEMIIKPWFCMCHKKIMGKKAIVLLICLRGS